MNSSTIKLDEIGFKTLSDERARNISTTSQLWRACFCITARCNFRCPYCNGLSCKEDMDFDWFRGVLDDMCINHHLRNIRFSGGEPTLHPWILNMVAAAQKGGVQGIACSTNGSASLKLYESMVKLGCNDFSISCDTCDPQIGKDLLGGINDQWAKVVSNIREVSKMTNVILGVTISDKNLNNVPEILAFCDSLGVADMKLSTATGYNGVIPNLDKIPQVLLDRHPILKYRVNGFRAGRNVRGLCSGDCHKCRLVMDDIIVVGDKHYPCIVYARERGEAIGDFVGGVAKARQDRAKWCEGNDTHTDPICSWGCMDIFSDCNNRMAEFAIPVS